MSQPPPSPLPGAILFACNLNKVRSPMVAALARRRWPGLVYVDSCGLQAAEDADPFVVTVMAELDLDLSRHVPKTFDSLEDGSFDTVISLTAEAQVRAERMARGRAVELEYWPILDPTLGEGSREQRLDLYRRVRDDLDRRLAARFAASVRQA